MNKKTCNAKVTQNKGVIAKVQGLAAKKMQKKLLNIKEKKCKL